MGVDQQELVRRAFAMDGEGAEAEFETAAEADEAVDGKDKETDAKKKSAPIPGWGSWTGLGAPASKSRKPRYQPPQPDKSRAPKPRVHVSKRRDRKAAEHQVKGVPFPFHTAEQYERSLQMPLGAAWNSARAHAALTKPSLVVKPGREIEPISFTPKDAEAAAEAANARKVARERRRSRAKPAAAS